MRTLNDIKHLLNEDAIRFVEQWTGKKWNTKVYFVQDSGNWFTVCIDEYSVFTGEHEGVRCLSLSKATSGGAMSTFYGDLKHFIKMAAANVARRRTGQWHENVWVNYEYVRRIEHWLFYRYGFEAKDLIYGVQKSWREAALKNINHRWSMPSARMVWSIALWMTVTATPSISSPSKRRSVQMGVLCGVASTVRL